MRKYLLTATIFTLFATNAYADTIKASVNGLVCAFCATGIEKTFKAQSAVENVKVDLDTNLVTITTKVEKNIDDATITKLLADSGYTVTGITREK